MRVVAAVIFGRMANGLLFFVLVVLFVVVRV
jgi:hypothetical protein